MNDPDARACEGVPREPGSAGASRSHAAAERERDAPASGGRCEPEASLHAARVWPGANAPGALLAIALALVGTVPAGAAPNVDALLARAFRSPRSVAHTGTLEVRVLAAPGSTATVRVSCDGRGRELRRHLTGPTRGLAVLTDGRSTWQRPSDRDPWTRSQEPALDDGAWDRLQRNYRFEPKGRERVAGRMAQVAAITPIHPGNPRSVLWVDAATALILRSESYTFSGDLAVATVYTKLKLGAPPAGELGIPAPGQVQPAPASEDWEKCPSAGDLQRRLGQPVALPTRLPAGYEQVGFYTRPCRMGGRLPVVRYSDGLNPLTLFVTRGQGMGRGGGGGWRGGRGGGQGRGGGGRGFGWGRGRGGGGPCVLEQVDGQQVARITWGGLTYLLIGDHSPKGLQAALQSIE